MEFDVRVILVGRTGLDAKLRLDPTIELVRVKSPLEAIGELSDPIEGYSPSRAVVVVGVDMYSDDPARGPAHADFSLRGTAAADFARALRLVDPNVRIYRAVIPSAGVHAGHSDSTPYYDDTVNADLPADALRTLMHQPSAANPVAKPNATEPSSLAPQTGPEPSMPETSPQTSAADAAPEPTIGPTHGPAEVLPRGDAPASEIGDAELVRLSLRGGDLTSAALRIVRARLHDPEAALADRPTPSASATVECEGSNFGYLTSAHADPETLAAHAAWLAAWLRLAQQQAQLREAAFTDPLTGAWNRRYFDKFLSTAIERARTGRQSVTLMLFDIDNFKQYNDRYGHAAADEILIETVRLLRSTIRPSDRVCRIGGDEFAVIFHEPAGPRVAGSTPPSSVFTITKRFQEQIKNQRFPKLGIEAPGTLTISGGLATFPWDGTSVGDLLRRADELAMESKRSGKNAIMFGPGAARGGPAG